MQPLSKLIMSRDYKYCNSIVTRWIMHVLNQSLIVDNTACINVPTVMYQTSGTQAYIP